MKKLFLTLAIAAASLCGFSQTISYEARDLQQVGVPSVNSDSTASVYSYVVTVGIVGDKYNFTSATPGANTITVTFYYKQKYSDDEKYKQAWLVAEAWVAQHYPSK